MKKLFLLFFILFISFSFGQSKNKQTKADSQIKNDEIHIVKISNDNSDDDLTVEPLNISPVINDDNNIYNLAGVEVKPEFPGGPAKREEFIKKNFVNPEEEEIKEKVYVTFIVEQDGSITDIKILRDIGFGSGQEVLRVLKKMPKWIPAQQNGKKVRCSYSLPIQVPQ